MKTALAAGSQPGAAQAEAPAIDVAGLVKRYPEATPHPVRRRPHGRARP
jgi:hypothetical protein